MISVKKWHFLYFLFLGKNDHEIKSEDLFDTKE